MNGLRIDALTRFVARRTGRRTLAAGALGGLLANLLPGLSALETAARKRKKRRCKEPKLRCRKACVKVMTNRKHCGRCNHRCRHRYQCRQGKCVPPKPPTLACGKGGPCRVFVTSSTYTGAMGGLSGADLECATLAQGAGLPGTYKAWLSDSTASVAERFYQNPAPYVLVDAAATPIVQSWADLTVNDPPLLHAINIMEDSQPVSDDVLDVWTGTSREGEAVGFGCVTWSSASDDERGTLGRTADAGGAWTNRSLNIPCDTPGHIYCFQQA